MERKNLPMRGEERTGAGIPNFSDPDAGRWQWCDGLSLPRDHGVASLTSVIHQQEEGLIGGVANRGAELLD